MFINSRVRFFIRLLFYQIPLTLIVSWLIGFFWYAINIMNQTANDTSPTDGIVVLTGGSERLDVGFDLLHQKMANKLFISGVYRSVDINKLIQLSHQNLDELACCVVLGHTAYNTAGNAIETATWMKKEDYHSLRLVTANYHMQRSLSEFQHVMPKVKIIPHPVFSNKVKQQWWLWPGTTYLIVTEYIKYLVTKVRHLIDH
ncbi:MAG: YdcF family protein [Rhodospirillaceae bacterium]|jgi:uncharacterized SAM-binding protein YcdF (DUF218 family)|nr:YdcF family protein [Rhodospirillaceae bacterium]